jgi:hypothetical protein
VKGISPGLGLTHDDTAVAGRILLELGADQEKIRAEVQRVLAQAPPRRGRPEAPVPGIRPPDWEYHVEQLGLVDELTQGWLNQRGSEGWELAAALPVSGGIHAVFKRRRPPGKPRPRR